MERIFDRLVSLSDAHAGKKIGMESRESGLSTREFEYSIFVPGPSKTSGIVVPEIRRRFDLKVIDWQSASRETSGHMGDSRFWAAPVAAGPSELASGRFLSSSRASARSKAEAIVSGVPCSPKCRANWPVLLSAGQLAWASGCPAADGCAAFRNTHRLDGWEEEFREQTQFLLGRNRGRAARNMNYFGRQVI